MAVDHTFRINPPFARLWNVNAILTAKIRERYQSSCTTNLTLKTVISGSAKYATRRSVYSVEPGQCFVLNEGQFYELDILPSSKTETLAIFFEPKFVQHALTALTTEESQLLDEPEGVRSSESPFVEALQPIQGPLRTTLQRIVHRLESDRTGELWLEDAFYTLASQLPVVNQIARAEWTRIPASRNVTRRELYRRLAHAKDYAYSCYQEDLNVNKLAALANLSSFHFHRMFRYAFGMTPNQFVRERRLSVARRLLESTNLPITQICLDVGFHSLGSFSTAFRERFGKSPRSLRRQTPR